MHNRATTETGDHHPSAVNVIITRPEPDASEFARELRAHGFNPLLSPAMTIELTDEQPDLDAISALAFTSANGCRAFAEKSAMRNLPVFAVGPETAGAARQAGFLDVEVANGNVASLVDLISSLPQKLSMLHVAGRDRAGDLVSSLNARQIEAKRAVLYRATPQDQLSAGARQALIDQPQRTWVTIFSPRTAHIFLKQIENAGVILDELQLKIVCLSKMVASPLVASGVFDVHVADQGTRQEMVDLMKRIGI